MNGQPKAGKPLREHGQNASGVCLVFTAEDEIVPEAKQDAATPQARSHILYVPFIHHLGQEEIAQQRCKHPSYNLAKYRYRGLNS
jgi:hypothetical protein